MRHPVSSPARYAFFFAAFAIIDSSWAVSYYANDIGHFSPYSINNHEQIIGIRMPGHFGVVYDGGTITELPFLIKGDPIINDSGEMLVATGSSQFLLYSGGNWSPIGDLPGGYPNNAGGTDLNNRGQVVGTDDALYDPDAAFERHSFLYSDGRMTDLSGSPNPIVGYGMATAINDTGQILFNSKYGSAIRNPDGTVTNLNLAYAYDVNNAGQVVGYASFGGQSHACLWSNGVVTDLGTLDGLSSYATKINNAGQIIGSSGSQPFLYTDGHMYDLSTLTGLDFSGFYPRVFTDINDNGVIVGCASGSSLMLSPVVPEPGSLILLAVGWFVGGMRRRQSHSTPHIAVSSCHWPTAGFASSKIARASLPRTASFLLFGPRACHRRPRCGFGPDLRASSSSSDRMDGGRSS